MSLLGDDVYEFAWAQVSLYVFIFLLTFGYHVKFKCAQGREIITPTVVAKTMETLTNVLLLYLKCYKWD